MESEISNLRKDVDVLNDFAFGAKDDPDDLGAKGDLKEVRKDVSQLVGMAKFGLLLMAGIMLTAIFNLVIKVP